jgi:hypothetical protein
MRTYIFRKGSRQKAFTDEVFTVDRVSRHNPNAYYLVDDDGEKITGKIYRRQLQDQRCHARMMTRLPMWTKTTPSRKTAMGPLNKPMSTLYPFKPYSHKDEVYSATSL